MKSFLLKVLLFIFLFLFLSNLLDINTINSQDLNNNGPDGGMNSNTNNSYIFEVGIPGVVKKGESLKIEGGLSALIPKLINFLFTFVGLLAFIMIFYAGFQYLTSGGNVSQQKDAFDRIANVIIGLFILFGFWLIIYTINPDILKFKEPDFTVQPIKLREPIGPGTQHPAVMTDLVWPAAGAAKGIVSSCFGYRDLTIPGHTSHAIKCHQGIDIAAPEGSPVLAVANGIIIDINTDPNKSSCGIYITIQHSLNKFYTTYCHLKENSIPDNIKKNSTVIKGQPIALVGKTGVIVGGDHLHFMATRDGKLTASKTADTQKINPACLFGDKDSLRKDGEKCPNVNGPFPRYTPCDFNFNCPQERGKQWFQ